MRSSASAQALRPQDRCLLVALRLQYLRLPGALRLQHRGLLLALRHGDRGLARALRLGDRRAPDALRRHLAVHRLLDVAGRLHFPDLDLRHLDAPALGDLVEFRIGAPR